MTAPAKLAAFAAGLAALFGAGALAGGATDPDARGKAPTTSAAKEEHGHAGTPAAQEGTTMNTHNSPETNADTPVRGLAVAEDGLRVELDRLELRRGRNENLSFRILDAKGTPVRKFDVTHERRMHLIIVRRDLTGFQHLHPKLGADGTWTAPVQLDEAGSYRLFADFSYEGEAVTLASDLRVDGAANLRPLPAPAAAAVSDGGYDVRIDAGDAQAGKDAELRFTITKDGAPVHTEPYLGAGGHLVALREGDLAFLHVHPSEHGDDEGHDDAIAFGATFPTEGRYRLFLQFKHEGQIQTVAFTQEVAR